jgi:hypothetical protein
VTRTQARAGGRSAGARRASRCAAVAARGHGGRRRPRRCDHRDIDRHRARHRAALGPRRLRGVRRRAYDQRRRAARGEFGVALRRCVVVGVAGVASALQGIEAAAAGRLAKRRAAAQERIEPEQVGGLVRQHAIGDQLAQQRGGLLDELAAAVSPADRSRPASPRRLSRLAGSSASAATVCLVTPVGHMAGRSRRGGRRAARRGVRERCRQLARWRRRPRRERARARRALPAGQAPPRS